MTRKNRARAHPHQAPSLSQLSLQVGMYQAALHYSTEMERAMRQVSVLLGIAPADAKARIDQARLFHPTLTVSDAKRRVLREHLEGKVTESVADWATRELARPHGSAHHRTVTVMGKPYHWRQDYTGQLKLAPGESPW